MPTVQNVEISRFISPAVCRHPEHPLFGGFQTVETREVPQDFYDRVLRFEGSFPDAADIVVTWDTEYVQTTEYDNRILSYQFCAVFNEGLGQRRMAAFIWWPSIEKPRLTFDEVCSLVMYALGIHYQRGANLRLSFFAHYSVAEWSSLADRAMLASDGRLDKVRNTFYSFKPQVAIATTPSRHAFQVEYLWRDSTLIAPAGFGSLERLLSFVSIPKVKLPDGAIAHMDTLLSEDRYLFVKYAMTDVVGLMEYVFYATSLAQTEFGLPWMPATLGAMAVNAFGVWCEKDVTGLYSIDKIKGFVPTGIKDEEGRKRKKSIPSTLRQFHDSAASSAYYGGLNTAERPGRFSDPDYVILDLDFSGAYPAAMACCPVISWDGYVRIHENVNAAVRAASPIMNKDHLGIAGVVPCVVGMVEFEFPSDCNRPAAPIQAPAGYGLVYPLRGTTFVTGPELLQVVAKGARISHCQIYEYPTLVDPFDDEGPGYYPAYARYLAELQRRRDATPKGTLLNALLKEAANSFYGKTAQGITDRVITNWARTESKQMEPSKVTCPIYAAITTGIVRAALLDMMDAAESVGCIVLSATTDGAMLAVPRNQITNWDDFESKYSDLRTYCPALYDAIAAMPSCRMLDMGKQNMGISSGQWLEVKHRGDQALTVKTRMYVLTYNGVPQHAARGGHQSLDKSLESAEDIVLMLSDSDTIETVEGHRLSTPDDILAPDNPVNDLVRLSLQRRGNADYDFKRRPVRDVPGRGWDTTPFRDINEFLKHRSAMEHRRKQGHRATIEDVQNAALGVQLRGGTRGAANRVIRRLLVGRRGGWCANVTVKGKTRAMTMAVMSERLGVPEGTLKADRQRQTAENLVPSAEVETVMREMAAAVGLTLTDEMKASVYGSNYQPEIPQQAA